MSYRVRLTLAVAAVAVAVAATSAITYALVRNELRGQVDENCASAPRAPGLRRRSRPGDGRAALDLPPEPFGGAAGITQLVTADGGVPAARRHRGAAGERTAPDGPRRDGPFFDDARVSGTHLRVYTLPSSSRGSRSRSHGRSTRSTLAPPHRALLFLIAAIGIGLAAGLGLVVSKAVLAPVQRLTRTAEEVSETRDLSRRIEASGNDELSRLATTFNTMLGALEESARAQRQLVSDASHELRTPLTSLRTNIEVLARDEALPPGEREQLLRDVTEQLTEMTALIAELVELARGDQAPADPEDVRLDLITAGAIERTRRNRPGIRFNPDLEGR